jgi:hypothetical protein
MLTDPIHSSTQGGHPLAIAANEIIANGIPVAFIPVAVGGTSITEWQPGGTYYNRLVSQATAAGTVKAVLWHQGENDVSDGMAQATYNAYLDTLANEIDTDLGCPLVAGKVHAWAAYDPTTINAAIAEAIADNANVEAGGDWSGLTFDGGVHATSDADIAAAGAADWSALEALFY